MLPGLLIEPIERWSVRRSGLIDEVIIVILILVVINVFKRSLVIIWLLVELRSIIER